MMKTYETTTIGVRQNKGSPRIWLETRRLEAAGFVPGTRYSLSTGDHRVVLTVQEDGGRVVTAHKKGEKTYPVIDINSAQALGLFEGLDRVRVIFRRDEIHILPLATQLKARDRMERVEAALVNGAPLRVASFCHGGGVLSQAVSDGMASRGIESQLVVANDFDREVLYHAAEATREWRDDTIAVAAPLQEIVTDDYLLQRVGKVHVVVAGLPCTAASLSGRSKKGLAIPEEDPNAGHLVVPFLAIIEKLQPAIVLLENVPPYATSASAHLIRHVLRDWGYNVQERILAARDFGCLEDRKRLCLIATTAGLHLDFDAIDSLQQPCTQRLGDVLEDLALDDPAWKPVAYLKAKEERDAAAGKGFKMQILTPAADRVGTIGSAYQKARSTEPRLAHPDATSGLSRLFTPLEHARIKGADPALIAGLPATRAHHLLGNAICVPPFNAVGVVIGSALRSHVPHGSAWIAMPTGRADVTADEREPAREDVSLVQGQLPIAA
jgi:DNA (cytosine-5)-methyltransferase 1